MFKMKSYKGKSIPTDDPFVANGCNRITQLLHKKMFGEVIESGRSFLKELCEKLVYYPDIYRLYNNIGIAYLQQGCTDLAKKMFELAVELEPSYEMAKKNLELTGSDSAFFRGLRMKLEKTVGKHGMNSVDKALKSEDDTIKLLKKIDKKMSLLNDEEIIAELHRVGIAVRRDTIADAAHRYASRMEVGRELMKGVKLKNEDFLFASEAIDCLSSRLSSGKIFLEDCCSGLLEIYERASDALEAKKADEAEAAMIEFFDGFKKEFVVEKDGNCTLDNWKFDLMFDCGYGNIHSFLLEMDIFLSGNSEKIGRSLGLLDELHSIFNDVESARLRAYFLLDCGQQRDGMEAFHAIVSKYPDDVETLIALGNEYSKASDSPNQKAAEAHFLKATKIALSDEDALMAKRAVSITANFLVQRGKFDEACDIEDKFIEWCRKNDHATPLFETLPSFARKYSELIRSKSEEEDTIEESQDRAVSAQLKSAKTGRNDPCPCGSGKKYKKCCLAKEHAAKTGEFLSDRAEIGAFLQNEIIEYLHRHIGKKEAVAIYSKYQSFVQTTGGFSSVSPEKHEDRDEYDLPDMSLLDLNDYAIFSHILPDNLTVFDRFLKDRLGFLPDRMREILKDWTTHRFGLWEVIDSKPGRWLKARDCFSDLTIESQGEETSKSASIYDIVMGRIESLSGNGAFAGPSLIVPRALKEDIVATIKQAALTSGYRHTSDFVHMEILKTKKIVLDIMKNKKPPLFVDHEGYPIRYCTAHYFIEDIVKLTRFFKNRPDFICDDDPDEEAASKKASYSLMRCGPSRNMPPPAKDIPHDAVSISCQSVSVSHPVPKEEDVLIAGVTITGRRVEIFAVSEPRFDYCKRVIEENLGNCIKFEKEERLDLGSVKKKEGKRQKKEIVPPDVIEKMMTAILKKHAREWVAKPIPALENKTPMQALRDPALKPVLVEIIKDMINHETTESGLQTKHILKNLGVSAGELDLKLP